MPRHVKASLYLLCKWYLLAKFPNNELGLEVSALPYERLQQSRQGLFPDAQQVIPVTQRGCRHRGSDGVEEHWA